MGILDLEMMIIILLIVIIMMFGIILLLHIQVVLTHFFSINYYIFIFKWNHIIYHKIRKRKIFLTLKSSRLTRKYLKYHMKLTLV